MENPTKAMDTGATSGPSPLALAMPAAATELAASSARSNDSSHSQGDEEDADADAGADATPEDLAAALDRTVRHNNIVVELDPLLEESSSAAGVAPKSIPTAFAATAGGRRLEAPSDMSVSGVPCVDMSVQTGELGPYRTAHSSSRDSGAAAAATAAAASAATAGTTVGGGCGCRGRRRRSRGPAETVSNRLP